MNTSIVWTTVLIGWVVTMPLSLPIVRAHGLRGIVAAGWLPAAAGWAVCAAVGWRPIGFSSPIVLLTAAHFTHAGFGVSVLLLAVGARRAFWVHQAAMFVVAIGLSADLAPVGSIFSRLVILQPIGAHVVLGVLCVYTQRVWTMPRSAAGWRRTLLRISSVAWAYPMLIAVTWAFRRVDLLRPVVSGLDSVVAQHGSVNAIGLVLFGVLALRTAPAAVSSRSDSSDVANFGDVVIKENRHAVAA